MVHLFVNSLIVYNTGIQYKKLNHVLAASILRFYDAFLGIIGNEPSVKYKNPSHHNFHQKNVSIHFDLKLSDETFDKRKKEVIYGFNDKNWLGVNI